MQRRRQGDRRGRRLHGRPARPSTSPATLANDTATVNIDRIAPIITGLLDRLPDVAGWYNKPVQVRYECADSLSGMASCNAPDIMPEGKASTLTGQARDAAGNKATTAVGPVQVDLSEPTLKGEAQGKAKAGWYNERRHRRVDLLRRTLRPGRRLPRRHRRRW